MLFERKVLALLAFHLVLLQNFQCNIAEAFINNSDGLEIEDFIIESPYNDEVSIRSPRSPHHKNHGNVNVEVNRAPGQGTHVRVEGNRDVWKSNDGRTKVEAGGHYDRTIGGPHGQPRKDYGGRVTFSHRFRRSPKPEPSLQPLPPGIQVPQGIPPQPGSSKDQSNGNVNVDVSRNRGEGTHVHVDADRQVWKSNDGRTKVEAGGHYDRTIGGPHGQPRKDYGGRVTFSHQFRRSPKPEPSLQPLPPGIQVPQGIPPQPSSSNGQSNGNVNVDVSRNRGEGTHIHVDADRQVWNSKDGKTRVEAGGHYDRTIGGPSGQPKKNYGGRVTFSHRFKRSPEPQRLPHQSQQPPHHGNFGVGIEQSRGSGPQLHLEANHNLWRSRNGMTTFEGGAFYDRNLGHRQPGMRRDNYGGQLTFSHRFKRSADDLHRREIEQQINDHRIEDDNDFENQEELLRRTRSPQQKNHGNVNVDVNRTPGQGTHVRVEGNRDVWKSNDGRSKVEAGGHYDRTISGGSPGQPRKDYGGHVTFSHRFRRSPEPQQQTHQFPQQPPHHGNVGIGIEQSRGSGAQLHLEANHDLWKSRNGRTTFEGGAFYDRNLGHRQPGMRRDNYGGQLTFTHRFKRSADDLHRREIEQINDHRIEDDNDYENQEELLRRTRSPQQKNHGNVNVEVNRTPGQGTHVRVEGNRDVWKSNDGRTKVEADGYYDRNIGGGYHGQRKEDYGGRIILKHEFD